jgi:hypothetical protein
MLLYLALEGTMWGAGAWISRGGQPRGAPLSVRRISERHREILEELLAGRMTYLAYSAPLGWTIRPGGVGADLYRANRSGFRARVEYAQRAPRGVVRIVTVGDSFTHGTDVRNEDTWQENMMALRPNLQVLNFGVGGYGPDQALLRYEQDGAHFNPQVVLFGYMAENFLRSVSTYRPFYVPGTGVPLAKPRFVLDGSDLRFVENPIPKLDGYRELLDHPERVLPRLGEHDYFFKVRPREGPLDGLPSVRLFKAITYRVASRGYGMRDRGYDISAEPYQVTARIIDRFFEAATKAGSVPVLVIFPDRGDVARHRSGGGKRYAPLLTYLRERGYRHVDLMEGFDKHARGLSLNELVPTHYSPQGNKITARTLLDYLVEQRLAGAVVASGR